MDGSDVSVRPKVLRTCSVSCFIGGHELRPNLLGGLKADKVIIIAC